VTYSVDSSGDLDRIGVVRDPDNSPTPRPDRYFTPLLEFGPSLMFCISVHKVASSQTPVPSDVDMHKSDSDDDISAQIAALMRKQAAKKAYDMF